jgi:hypothetical protein
MKAMKKAFEWMDKKELIIYDGRGAKEKEIMDFIRGSRNGSTDKLCAEDTWEKRDRKRQL